MKIAYVEMAFRDKTMQVISQANEIITKYQAMGYKLTLRQLYYQFVSRDLIANKQTEYKRLGSIINDARLAGLADWEAIEDRGRNLLSLPTWTTPSEILDSCASQYRENPWNDQPSYLEVWIEKEALIGVIEGVYNTWRCPHFACKGCVSQSEMHAAAGRFRREAEGREAYLLHLGDHDPLGMDMTRDIENRLGLFGAEVHVRRLALNPHRSGGTTRPRIRPRPRTAATAIMKPNTGMNPGNLTPWTPA